jgi:hypothetical protein
MKARLCVSAVRARRGLVRISPISNESATDALEKVQETELHVQALAEVSFLLSSFAFEHQDRDERRRYGPQSL